MVKKSLGRKLYGVPVLLQDWDTEADELSSKYWELFLDLLLVAASSAIADGFSANPTWMGLLEFASLYTVVVNGYMAYSPQHTTRFEDASLLHSAVLFPYLLGISICTINASFVTAANFCFGAWLQRVVLIFVLAAVYQHIERARAFSVIVGIGLVLNAAILAVGILFPQCSVVCIILVAILESLLVYVQSPLLSRSQLVPINIEHTKDRLGCLVLVMLGETVVAGTIQYRLVASHAVASIPRYYWTLGLSFLLIFAFTLLFFHMQPAPQDTGFHRSRIRGILLFGTHKNLGMALLAVGVSERLMVDAVVRGVPMSRAATVLTGMSVSLSILLLLVIRILHYGIKGDGTFDSSRPLVQRIVSAWAAVYYIAVALAALLVLTDIRDPVWSAAVYSGIITSLCVIESSFTHVLEPYVMRRAPETSTLDVAETEPLQTDLQTSEGYQSLS